jgi:hypothetical protein
MARNFGMDNVTRRRCWHCGKKPHYNVTYKRIRGNMRDELLEGFWHEKLCSDCLIGRIREKGVEPFIEKIRVILKIESVFID